MKIKDVMSTPVIMVPAFAQVGDVARHMDYSGVGSVLVSDGQDVVGIVTDRDLVLRVLARGAGVDTTVGHVMTPAPVVVRPDDDLDLAFEVFRRHAFRRLPVVDAGTVVGVVTVDDLLLQVHRVSADLLKPVISEISDPQHSSEP